MQLSGHGLTSEEMCTVLAKLDKHLRDTAAYAQHRPLVVHAAQNRLSSTLPLGRLADLASTLVELHLPHNHIKAVSGLETLTALQVLDLSNNDIAKTTHLRALSFNSQLGALCLRDNPLALALTPQQLRIAMLHLLPSLRSLDGKPFFSPSSSVAPAKKTTREPRPSSLEINDESNSYLALHRAAQPPPPQRPACPGTPSTPRPSAHAWPRWKATSGRPWPGPSKVGG